MFPKVKFAFFGNYVNRYRRNMTRKVSLLTQSNSLSAQQLPSIDLILSVENTKEFHVENMKLNKNHYTYFVRSTSGKAVHWI